MELPKQPLSLELKEALLQDFAWKASLNDLENMKLLLEGNSDINVNSPSKYYGDTPLLFLLKKWDGLETKLQDVDLTKLEKKQCDEILTVSKMLIDKGADLFTYNLLDIDTDTVCPLLLAPYSLIKYVFDTKNILSNAEKKDVFGNTALMLILQNKNLSLDQKEYFAQELIKKDKKFVSEKNYYDENSLMVACDQIIPNKKIIKLLLKNGVDIDQEDLHEDTAILYLFGKYNKKDPAFFTDYDDNILKLLLSYNPELNLNDALEKAIEYNRPAMIKSLLDHGAVTNFIDCKMEKTSLIRAIEFGSWEAAKMLYDCGDQSINDGDYAGYTPLMYALIGKIEKKQNHIKRLFTDKDLAGIKFLIEHSNLFLKNNDNDTAFDILKKHFDKVIEQSKIYASVSDTKENRKNLKIRKLHSDEKDLKTLMGMIQQKQRMLSQVPQPASVNPDKRILPMQDFHQDTKKKIKVEEE